MRDDFRWQPFLDQVVEDLVRDVITENLIGDIKKHRKVLREHRDQKGDDRCWADDYLLAEVLGIAPPLPTGISYEEGMRRCRQFYHCCRLDHLEPNPPDAILDPARWDDDLASMDPMRLDEELKKIKRAFVRLLGITDRPRTVEDYKELYAVFPEKIQADFRLPPEPEFLGEAKAGAGCPNFWKSHSVCPDPCNYHQWGPCIAD